MHFDLWSALFISSTFEKVTLCSLGHVLIGAISQNFASLSTLKPKQKRIFQDPLSQLVLGGIHAVICLVKPEEQDGGIQLFEVKK